MNVDRLQQITADVRRDLEATQLEQRLAELDSALQQVVSQPNQEAFQTQVEAAVEKLASALSSAPSNSEGALWWHLVEELNLTDVLPRSIITEVEDILSRRMLPILAVQKIRELRTRIAQKRERIDHIIESLKFLGIKKSEIPAGRAQISILIPREAVDSNLNNFGEEAQELNGILNDIFVAGTGQPEELKIQALSTSDFMVDLNAASNAALHFSMALGILVGCYVKIVRLHSRGQELAAEGISDADIKKLIGGHVRKQVGEAISEATNVLLDASKANKTQRNDRTARTKRALRQLAERLNKGYNFDVQPSDDDTSEKAVEDAVSDAAEIAKRLLEIRKTIQFVNIPGKEILELPPGDDNDAGGPDDQEPPDEVVA